MIPESPGFCGLGDTASRGSGSFSFTFRSSESCGESSECSVGGDEIVAASWAWPTPFTERWQGAPLMAGFKRAKGAVLWIAASPGPRGYERFPYIPQALADLGLEAPFRSERLWAFFDSAYRSRVDIDYFAARWKAAGIGALHVAAWHYWERDPQGDEYLHKLIEACHRNGIVVYAWLELPHVSEKFWDQHPEWREKTALLQDAQLDWRKLMNLTNRAAFAEVSKGVRDLIGRFDWDGVNLAELYFESLEGIDNPARLTPMNDDVRAEFREKHGFDPIELFSTNKPLEASAMVKFIDFRADLARRQQAEWLLSTTSGFPDIGTKVVGGVTSDRGS